jgi:ABC-type Mn2+/Zn2+ transport system permease subunit
MAIKNQRLTGILLAVATLLLIPFIAMQFTKEVNWTLFDFVVAGTLLFGTGLLIEFVLRTVSTAKYRIALCAVVLVALLLIWIELAVGIFGSPIAGS